jgi:2,4-dienoyl-CoA reductase (NADPH2)
MAMRVPGKEEIAGTIAYYRETLHRLGVQTLLHTPADFSRLVVESDAIFVATGVNPKGPDIPGSTLPHVLLYPTAFAEPQTLQGDIVIIGGGGIGLDLALFLAAPPELGLSASANFWDELPTALPWDSPVRSITVITRGKAGKSVGRSTRWILRQVLQHLGVILEENAEARAITMDGVEITQNGVTKFLPADGVVISTGQVSNLPAFVVDHPLASFHVIGGAREARALDMVRAIAEGLRGAYNLAGMTDKIFS